MSTFLTDYINLAVLIALIVIILLVVLVIVLFVKTSRQQRALNMIAERYDAFMTGRNAESLEDRLILTSQDMKKLDLAMKNQRARMDSLEDRLHGAFRKSAIVRYNSSVELGGIMSFVLVLLDEHNDGFLLNVIHSREGSYPYIKRIIGGEAEMDLSREEARALETALIQE